MLLYTLGTVKKICLYSKIEWFKVFYLTFSKKFRSSNEELDIECHHGQGVLLCGSNLTIYQIRGVLIQASLFGNLLYLLQFMRSPWKQIPESLNCRGDSFNLIALSEKEAKVKEVISWILHLVQRLFSLGRLHSCRSGLKMALERIIWDSWG